MNRILDTVKSPADLQKLSIPELQTLCGELRQEIIASVSVNGGHLSPNLGVVELTVALERTFGGPDDAIIWDVGHQSYSHKLLTGRLSKFRTLRKFHGLSGFQTPQESPADKFYTGHAGVSISEAMGLAEANAAAGKENAAVVAVIGDGSLGCGIALEALNNIQDFHRNFILVINDNHMAISRSVGAVSNYLNHVITGRGYNRFKTKLKAGLRKLPCGRSMIAGIKKLETATKSLFVSGAFFEQLGMKYVGPINGHDLPELLDKFEKIRDLTHRPVVVHVVTNKGQGCKFAEEHPERFHGCGPFQPLTGEPAVMQSAEPTFSEAFATAVTDLAENNSNIVAITAAMASGTKLNAFRNRFPQRFYDVGIAEEHALVFASGLAAGGLRPFVAIYATFLQRALDCIFHDICLQNLPVVICADRAGVVEDGPTHHGIYDLPFLLSMPNLNIYLPRDASELREMLSAAYLEEAPVMLRYPRGSAADLDAPRHPFKPGRADEIRSGSEVAFWCAGRECTTGLAAAELLAESGISASVVNIRSLKPFDTRKLITDAASKMVVTIEDSQNGGGLASLVDSTLINAIHRKILHYGWTRGRFIPHGKVSDLRQAAGLSPEEIAGTIAGILRPDL